MTNKEIFRLFDDELLTFVLNTIYQSMNPDSYGFTERFHRRINAILAGKYRVPLWFDNRNEVLGRYDCLDRDEFEALVELFDCSHKIEGDYNGIRYAQITRENLENYIEEVEFILSENHSEIKE